MPFRKNVRKVVNKDKILTRKLMQLNFIVDDHIYKKNRRISVTDANIFLRDLASMREQTKKHIRLSQVAEKLTRVMRGIIAEQQDAMDVLNIDHQAHLRTNSQKDNNDRSEISRLYFANEEIQRTKDKPEDENKKMLNNIEIVYICDDEDTHLNNSNTNISNYGKNSEVVVSEISAQISQLSMHETNSTPIPSTCDSVFNDCSQSILGNYENDVSVINGQKENHQLVHGKVDVVKNILVAANNLSSEHLKFAVREIKDTKENNTAKMPSVSTSSKRANRSKNYICKKAIPKPGRKSDNNVSRAKRVAKKPGRNNQDKSITDSAINPTERQKNKVPTVKKQMKDIKAVKVETVKKQMKIFDEIKEQKKGIDTNTGTAVHILKDTVQKTPTEIDLSWIESIKFVRIIEDSEYIPTYQSLWDNCEFPQSYDESDFNNY